MALSSVECRRRRRNACCHVRLAERDDQRTLAGETERRQRQRMIRKPSGHPCAYRAVTPAIVIMRDLLVVHSLVYSACPDLWFSIEDRQLPAPGRTGAERVKGFR